MKDDRRFLSAEDRRDAQRAKTLISRGLADADRLFRLRRRGWVEVVTCGYDTGFASVEDQVVQKLAQLRLIFPVGRDWRCSLRVIDDTPPPRLRTDRPFAPAVRAGFRRALASQEWSAKDLNLQPLFGAVPGVYGQKGLALREAMLSALEPDTSGVAPDFIVYVNLNAKVDACQIASGLLALHQAGWDAAIGSRARADGGVSLGAGPFLSHGGRSKSRAWASLVSCALPPLFAWPDQNAPLKIFNRTAARALCARARIDGLTLDCEWLCILAASGLRFGRFPVAWIQRKGSRPPLRGIASMLSDLRLIQSALRKGALRHDPDPGQ